ncbi:uncharacterized protein [Danio rerio]|uniref:non-specific serine/threonine protein kinase n=1 Tax=Danio rerio TaxID=7955 RepID=A0AB32TQA9_DANRE
MTLATCFASQMEKNKSTVFFNRVKTITTDFVNNNHQSDTMASRTPPAVMRSPTENPEKGRKGNKASAFLKRAWKAVKRPFLSSDRSRVVVPFEPRSDIDDFEHLPVPGPSRIVIAHADPEPVWLPGQVCEDPQLLSIPGPSRITADAARPESSTALTGQVDPELMRPPVQVCDRLESLAVPGTSRIKPTTIADHVDSEQMRPPVQICEDSQPLSVPGPSRIKQAADVLKADPARPESSTALTGHVDTELVCLPGQICKDPRLISVHGLSNVNTMTDADSACPESPPSVKDPSKIDGTDEKPKKERKGKRVSAFFKRAWKAAKLPLLFCGTDKVQHLMLLPEPVLEAEAKLEPEPEQKPKSEPEPQPQPQPHLEPKPEPNPEPEPEDEADPEAVPVKVTPGYAEPADPESVCLPGQVPEEPNEGYGLTLGSVVADFEVKDMIGKGGFGQVYVASHVSSEKEKVALKYIIKHRQDRYLNIDGHSRPMLAEVAIMLRLMKAPQCPNIIRLHDWIENESDCTLILEYPESCQTLDRYITDTLDMNENKARRLMRQLVQAVRFCVERGVFHGDIHARNILVTTPRLELKLIDFGCAWPVTRMPFYSWKYQGARCYTPPEILRHPKFFPSMANIWAIGILLYEIMHGRLPFYDRQSIMVGDLHLNPTLSSACQDLISKCLIRNPVRRILLHQVEEHQWFNATSPNAVQQ